MVPRISVIDGSACPNHVDSRHESLPSAWSPSPSNVFAVNDPLTLVHPGPSPVSSLVVAMFGVFLAFHDPAGERVLTSIEGGNFCLPSAPVQGTIALSAAPSSGVQIGDSLTRGHAVLISLNLSRSSPWVGQQSRCSHQFRG